MSRTRRLLVTGGAGFIGTNAVRHFAGRGWRVHVIDNLSRPGSDANLEWLRTQAEFEFEQVDVRDAERVARTVQRIGPDGVLHLAGQVAVTTSVSDPRTDFEVNALGTFNVLEAIRLHAPAASLLFASTNKVYGALADQPVERREQRYVLRDRPNGIDEAHALDLHSPYGCSKGAADQYVLDYSRIYGLNGTSFRQSCIYGPRQFGIEDQGWVAWFAIAAVTGRPITLYGDGFQVRDILHVDDLLRAYELAFQRPDAVRGQAFNLGGGPGNTISLRELLHMLKAEFGLSPNVEHAGVRPGDQPVFVCCVDKLHDRLGWTPKVGPREGIKSLVDWIGSQPLAFPPQALAKPVGS